MQYYDGFWIGTPTGWVHWVDMYKMSVIGHISHSKTFDGKKVGYIFRTDDVGLDYGNLEILNLERLCWDYITTNQAPKEDWNKEPAFLPLASLPDLSGSSSLTMNSRYASSPPRICLYCDKYKNPDVEAVFIKKGALVLTDESGISMSEEDFDKYSLLCLQSVIFHCFDVVLA